MQEQISEKMKPTRISLGEENGRSAITPLRRARLWLRFQFLDHALLRTFWTNFAPVADGVFRSNQPSSARLKRMARRGIRTIVNLRGASAGPHYVFEKEACDRFSLTLIDVPMHARQAMTADVLLELIDVLRSAEKPFVMHCKSGADRAGLAAAIYRIVIDGAPVAEAQKHLSLRYLHDRNNRVGICDALLEAYAERNSASAIGFEDWIRSEYDPAELQARFDAGRRKGTA